MSKNSIKPITKAIFPIAGMGTRTLPASMAIPKEMFPLIDTPIIQHLVKDAKNVGVTLSLMVTGREKRALEDHFDRNANLEEALIKKGKSKEKELELVREVWNMMEFGFVRQPEPLGDGHAILQAERLLDLDDTVYVLFGDTIAYNPMGQSSLEQMLEVYNRTQSPVVLVAEVPDDQLCRFGVAAFQATKYGLKLTDFVEKPKTKDAAPSNLVAVGQYIITPGLRNILRSTQPGDDKEIRLAGALKDYMELGHPVYACKLEGEWLDTGDKFGYFKAILRFALDHDEIGAQVEEFIRTLQNK